MTDTTQRIQSSQEADALMWDILRLIWKTVDRRKPTAYEVRNLGDIQHRIIDSLAAGRFVTMQDATGDLVGYCGWYKTDLEGIEAALKNMFPVERNEGYYGYVTDFSAKPGYTRQMIRHVRDATGRQSATWYRGKNGKVFCGEKHKFEGDNAPTVDIFR